MYQLTAYVRVLAATVTIAALLIGMTIMPAAVRAQSENADAVRFLAWELGSRLSLAALGYGRGVDQAIVNEMIDQVRPAAAHFGMDIPSLPPREGDPARDSAAVLYYLLNTVSDGMGGVLSNNYPSDYSLLFEIAIKSNVLHLMYVPNDELGFTIADVIRDRAPRAGIPYNLWRPVVDGIESGAPEEEITAAVRAMHENVSEYLYPQ